VFWSPRRYAERAERAETRNEMRGEEKTGDEMR
jgi:hypothetical protein